MISVKALSVFYCIFLIFGTESIFGMFLIYSVSKKEKKGNRDSILNLSKSKRRIIKLLSVDDSIFIFLSYGTLVVHIGSGMAAQQSFL